MGKAGVTRRPLYALGQRLLGASLLSLTLTLTAGAAETEPPPGTYRVVEGKVDKGTFAGWVAFHTACFICHGRDATGTDIAPSLMTGMTNMSRQEFANKVLTRYRYAFGAPEASSAERNAERERILAEVGKSTRGKGGTIAMPAWQDNPGIEAHLLDLYAYLKARADGALGPGQPSVAPH